MELISYLRILLKRWWIIAPIFIVTVAGTAYLTWRQGPTYSATTTFVVSPSSTIFEDPRYYLSGLDVLGGRAYVATTYSDIATSRRLRKEAIAALGLNDVQAASLNVKSKLLAGTNVIDISVEGPDPTLVANFANTLGETTVAYVKELYGVFDLQILDRAEVPSYPIRPNWMLNLALASILSLGMGAGLAILAEYLDDTLRSPEEISRLFNAPLIGFIPVMARAEAQGLYMVNLPRSAVAEAFRSLRANLEFASVDQPLKTILVTSVGSGEGKSSVSANLALALAQSGKKVLLIDTDLRCPTLHQFFSIHNQQGLSDIIRGRVNLAEAMHRSADGGIDVIPSGLIPPNPAEMLSSKKMEHVLETLKEAYDVVILDSAPFLVADAWALSAKVDGVVLVVQPGRTIRKAARASVDQIQRGRVRVVGVVLNRMANGSSSYYYSGYLADEMGYEGRRSGLGEKNGQSKRALPGLKIFSALKRAPANGHNHLDPRMSAIPAPVVERISAEYTQDILDFLLKISTELPASGDLAELLPPLLQLVLNRIGSASGSIVILDEAGEVASGAVAYAGKVYLPAPQQLNDTVQCGLAGWVIQNREAVLVVSTRDDSRWLMRPWELAKKVSRSAICSPLTNGERVVGAITLVHPRPGKFTQYDLVLLKSVGVYFSINSTAILPAAVPTP